MSTQSSPAPDEHQVALSPLRALLVYESMFGSTQAVAAAVADGLRAEGVETELVDVRHAPAAREAAFDLLVVGAPTHAFSLSRPSTRQDAVRQGALVAGELDHAVTWAREVARAARRWHSGDPDVAAS